MEQEVKTSSAKPSLLGMIWSPGEQFDRIRQNPRIWVPLILVSIIYSIGMFLMAMSMDASYLGLEGMSDAEAEMVMMFARGGVAITGIFTPVFVALISSAIYMIFTKIAGSEATFKQLFSMNVHIIVIGGFGLIVNMALRAAIGGNPEIFITSLAGLMNSEKPGVLGSIELFSIWQSVITALGLQRVAGLSKGWAWGIAIAFFIIGILFALLSNTVSGMTGV
ncbi:permease [Cytobacillus firmus]|uniref:Yip1 family protein n=1 Tax=Cytobacillus firmus TaxID=1399 RepID=UPI00077C3552|nr:Yip1 family protein [Cytobacillus firmus]MBG9543773.1 permease [Cytobacillus firmus]MBG9553110.1 permease [Cytobacillus firmus]MBG9555907.1 permease [Cytobacillus firmus]MBG9574901.1 permease [Cytobacillus firmus]MEC1891928.1 Yip1 family protein [Cytobacillus firmus]